MSRFYGSLCIGLYIFCLASNLYTTMILVNKVSYNSCRRRLLRHCGCSNFADAIDDHIYYELNAKPPSAKGELRDNREQAKLCRKLNARRRPAWQPALEVHEWRSERGRRPTNEMKNIDTEPRGQRVSDWCIR